MLFDTHAHLTDERFANDREAVIARMVDAGVTLCLTIGDGSKPIQPAIQLAKEYDFIYAGTGLHPHDALHYNDEVEASIKHFMKEDKVVALGEIGLDYYYDLSPRELQKEAFVRQLQMAKELEKPAIFHIRDAHGDALDIFRAHKGNLPSGVMHCYGGSWESAKEYLNLGYYISLAGPVTFKNAAKLPEIALKVPSDRLLIETDCPYLAPMPMRGKRNEPAFITNTARCIADYRGIDYAELCHITMENGKRLFGV